MDQPKRVLIFVSDKGTIWEFENRGIRQHFDLITSLPPTPRYKKYRQILGSLRQYHAIVWDERIGVRTPQEGYIQEAKKFFQGPMIAFTDRADIKTQQMVAGCTHNARGHVELENILGELLG